jgi:hypothetical protein
MSVERSKGYPHRDLLLSASPALSPSPPPVPSTNVLPTSGSAGSFGSYVTDELRPSMGLFSVLFSARAFPAPPGARSAAQPAPTQPLPSVSTGTLTPPSPGAPPCRPPNTSVPSDAIGRFITSESTSALTSTSSFALLASDPRVARVVADMHTTLSRTPRPALRAKLSAQ